MKFIVVNGKPGSGKDTFIENILLTVPNCKSISTVDQEYIAAKELGWDGKKDWAGRKLLFELKQAKIEYNYSKYNHTMDKYVYDQAIKAKQHGTKFLFIHCREPREIKKIVDSALECITVLIKNPRVDRLETSNQADRDVDRYIYDHEIINDGSKEEFYKKTMWFVHNIIMGD